MTITKTSRKIKMKLKIEKVENRKVTTNSNYNSISY